MVSLFALGPVHMNSGQRYVSGQAIVAGKNCLGLLVKE